MRRCTLQVPVELCLQLICMQVPPRRLFLSLPGMPGMSTLLSGGMSPAALALFSSRSCSWLGQPLRGAPCRQPGLLLRSPP